MMRLLLLSRLVYKAERNGASPSFTIRQIYQSASLFTHYSHYSEWSWPIIKNMGSADSKMVQRDFVESIH